MSEDKSGRADREPVIAKLKQLKAAQLELTLADGTTKRVALAKAGNRWAKLVETLDGFDWHFIEAQDEKGAVLGRIENDEDVDEGEDGYDDAGGGACPTCGRKSEMKTLLKVMQTVMRETRLGFSAQMDGNAKLVEHFGEATSHLTESYAQSAKLREGMAAASEATGSPEFAEMLKLAMMLMAQNSAKQMGPGK